MAIEAPAPTSNTQVTSHPHTPQYTERVTKSGKSIMVDVSPAACARFGFHPNEPVETPLGLGHVCGVADGHLWFLIGSDHGLSYFGTCRSAKDFENKKIIRYAGPEPIALPPSMPGTSGGGSNVVSFALKAIPNPHGGSTRIVMQQVNGACPLLGIANALILSGRLNLDKYVPSDHKYISDQTLADAIADVVKEGTKAICEGAAVTTDPFPVDPITGIPSLASVMESAPHRASEFRKYFEKVEKQIQVLKHGLCVSPMFSEASAFDYIETLALFPMLQLKVLHAWLLSAEDPHYGTLFTKSYDVLMNITLAAAANDNDTSSPTATMGEDIATIERFIEETRLQMTEYGLMQLPAALEENDFAVYFCNNHFSTITKHGGVIYRLVTDVGYVEHADIVWEKLTLTGDSPFFTAHYTERQVVPRTSAPDQGVPGGTLAGVVDRDSIIFSVMEQHPAAEYTDVGSCFDAAQRTLSPPVTKEKVSKLWNERFGMGRNEGTNNNNNNHANMSLVTTQQPQQQPHTTAGGGSGLSHEKNEMVQQLISMGFPYDRSVEVAKRCTTLDDALTAMIS